MRIVSRLFLIAFLGFCVACAPRGRGVSPRTTTTAASQRQALAATTAPVYRGVNLDGADFGSALPGREGTDYTWPTTAEVDYFLARGMNSFRIGFRWERLQHTALGELDAAYGTKLDALVGYATQKRATVLLNPQNFARYYGGVVGSAAVPDATFADLWRRLALRYKGNALVTFGLVNEPNTMPTEQWVRAANAAIAAIRGAGATNLISVPGNAWTGASSWTESWYGTSNAVAMLAIVDPADHFVFEIHDYLDSDASGGGSECVSPTIGSERMAGVVAWARAHGRRLWIAEMGAPPTLTCQSAVRDLLSYANANGDTIVGWSWWSAGPWWHDYALSIEPNPDGSPKPQMTWLAEFLPTPAPTPAPPPSSALVVTSRTTSDWGAGYCVEFTIANRSSVTTRWSSLAIDLADGQLQTGGNVWGGGVTGAVTMVPSAASASLSPGRSAAVGACVVRGASRRMATAGVLL